MKRLLIIFLCLPSLTLLRADIGNDLNQLFEGFFGQDDAPLTDETEVPTEIEKAFDIPDIEIDESPTEANLTEIRQQIFLEEASLEDFESRIQDKEAEIWEIGNQQNRIEMQLTQLDSQLGINTKKLEEYKTLTKKWKATLEETTRKKSETKAELRVLKREYEKFMSRNFIRNEYFGSDEDISAIKWLFSDKTVSQILEEKHQQREKEKEQKAQLKKLQKTKRELDAEEKRSALIYGRIAKMETKIAQEKINLSQFSEGRANLLAQLQKTSQEKETALKNYVLQKNEAAIYLQNLHQALKETQEQITLGEGTPAIAEETPTETTSFFSSPLKLDLKVTAPFQDPAYEARFGRTHNGVDLFAPQGSDLLAIADGVVEKIGLNNYGYSYLILKHPKGFYSIYGHLSGIEVEKGEALQQGQLIGKTGGTPGTKGAGYFTTGPHLHLELFQNGRFLDPLRYLPDSKVSKI